MRKYSKRLLTGVLIICFVFMFSGFALSEGDVTVVGTVNDENQIVDDGGVVYEVADNDMSGEVMEHVGKKIQVKGTVMEDQGLKTITIKSYTLVEE